MNKLINNKKGSSFSVLIVLLILIGMAFGAVIFYNIVSQALPVFSDKLTGLAPSQNVSIAKVFSYAEEGINLLDYGVVAVFIALIIGIIVSSFLLDVHPLFVGIYLLVMVMGIFVSFPLSNAYIMFEDTGSTLFVDTFTHFPMTTYIMENLPKFTIAIFIISIIVLYAKSRVGGGEL